MGKRINKNTALFLAGMMAMVLFASVATDVYAGDIAAGERCEENHGPVDTNNGTIGENCDDGWVENNSGTVEENYGTIETNNNNVGNNYHRVNTNAQNAEIVNNFNGGTVSVNYGTIDNNTGDHATVVTNNGTIKYNSATVGGNDYGTVEINDGGTVTGDVQVQAGETGKVIVNVNGSVGNIPVVYSLGNNAHSSATVQNHMWQIIPLSENDWSKMDAYADNMLTFSEAVNTYNSSGSASAWSLVQKDVDGSIMSVWVSDRNDNAPATIYLAPVGTTRAISNVAIRSGHNTDVAIIEQREDGRWEIRNVTGDVYLTYVLVTDPNSSPSSGTSSGSSSGEDDEIKLVSTVVPIARTVAEWTISEVKPQVVLTVGGVASSVKMNEVSDPQIKTALYDFLVKSLPAAVDVSKIKVAGTYSVNLDKTGVLTLPVDVRLAPGTVVYVSCRDIATGQMKLVVATVTNDGKISFEVPFKDCTFSIMTVE